ncbi:MAG: porin [Verrucomicrobiales bacterium]|nr:porin [Verrucomicrobiales bacterium]
MTQNNRIHQFLAVAGLTAAFAASSLVAGDYGKAIIDDKMPIESSWTFCDIFDNNTLYEGDGFIKEVSFHGRYHGQFISGDEEINGVTNNGYHNWHHRRFRLALEVEMQNNLTFYAEANIADGTGNSTNLFNDPGPFFNDFQDLYIEWEPSDDFFLKVGKQKQHLTREDIESSKRIKTVERSAIVNEVAGARPWGAVVGFNTGELSHQIGGWVHGAHADSPEWVDMSSNTGFSYNLEVPVSDTTSLFFDYVFVDNDEGNEAAQFPAANGTSGAAYEHAFAIGAEIESGKFQLMTDLIYGANRSGGGGIPAGNDTWGFYVVPSYDITDKLEAVFRYGYLAEGREQRPQRFGAPAGGNFGGGRQSVEHYHTIYAGLQYFICGEKLKVMGGYEYATGEVFGTDNEIKNGQWQLAVRTYW